MEAPVELSSSAIPTIPVGQAAGTPLSFSSYTKFDGVRSWFAVEIPIFLERWREAYGWV